MTTGRESAKMRYHREGEPGRGRRSCGILFASGRMPLYA